MRDHFRKTVMAALGTAAIAGGLLAGSVGVAAQDEAWQGVDDGTALTMWTRAATEARAQALVDAYNASHQNQIELRIVPTDEYVATVGTAATAGQLPDLFSADVVFMPNWTSAGLFTDLTDRIEALPYIDNVGPAHIDASTWDGVKYGLPFIIDLSVWMYNKALFREAGLDPEAPPTTLAGVRRCGPRRPGAGPRRRVRHVLRWRLRRLQRLHVVADHVGRG